MWVCQRCARAWKHRDRPENKKCPSCQVDLERTRREVVAGNALPTHEMRPLITKLFAVSDAVSMATFIAAELQQTAAKLPPDEQDRYVGAVQFNTTHLERAKRIASEMLTLRHLLTVAGLKEYVRPALLRVLDRVLGPHTPSPRAKTRPVGVVVTDGERG